MKIIRFIIVATFLVLFIFTNQANAFTKFKQGEYLEKNQWGALEDIMTDWKSGKLTTDECAIYGCYVLTAQEPARADRNDKAKLIPTKYRLNKKSIESGPYFFIYFLYKNEENLGEHALNEFRNSDWCEEEFLQAIISNNEVNEVLNSFLSLPIEKTRGKIRYKNNKYDFYDVIFYLSEKKNISYDTAYICIACNQFNHKKFNKKFNGFLQKYNLMVFLDRFSYIRKILDYVSTSKNRKAINIFNFYYYYSDIDMLQGMINNNGIYKKGFYVSGADQEVNEEYCDYFIHYYNVMCKTYGYKEPINFINNKTIEVILNHTGISPPKYGNIGANTPSFQSNTVPIITGFRITLNLDDINYLKKMGVYSPCKAVIHELFHAVQVSYFNKDKNFYWYESKYGGDGFNFAQGFADSTGVWAEDYFYDENDNFKNYRSTIYESAWYFYNSVESDVPNYEFPGYGLTSSERYCWGFLWDYYTQLIGENSVKSLIEKIADQKASEAIIKSAGADIIHKFGIKNFLLGKNKGIDQLEDEFASAESKWKPLMNGYKELKIHDDLLPTYNSKIKISLDACSTKLIKVLPKNNFFENSVFINFKYDKKLFVSVITAWIDVNSKDNKTESTKYTVTDLNCENGKAMFRYYTKKGLNPKYFVVLLTNGDYEDDVLQTVDLEVTIDKPIATPIASLEEAITTAGNNFKNDIISIFSKDSINRISKLDSELSNIYSKYKTASEDERVFLGRQLYQKLKDVNLLMQTMLNQVHDLRYQYYLIKKEIVNSIMEGATSSSIKNQILKYCNFVKKMAKIIDTNTNSIDVFNGWVVMYHIDNKLKTTKAPASWTDEEYASFDKESNAAMKKISSAFSNSKYEYKYTNEQIKDSVSTPMVGVFAIEIPGPIVNPPPIPITPGPFMVNFSPNIENTLVANKIPISYKFSSLITNGFDFVADGKPYNSKGLLCISDTFSPLSLKYFSSIAVHAYHEDNMPPQPAVSNVKGYVSSLGFYMKVCKDHASDTNTTDAFFNTKDIMIGGASKRITEIICLLAEAIMQELKNGKNDIYTALNKELALVPYKDEVLDLLEKQLKKDGYRE